MCFGTRVVFRTTSDDDKTRGEGVEQDTFLSFDETKAKDEADNLKEANDNPKEDECFGSYVVCVFTLL